MREQVHTSDVRVTVDPAELGEVEMIVRVVAPAAPAEGAPIFFCVPGMSYGKEYFDLPIDGYSFARAAAEAGCVVVAVDNVGTGDSERPADAEAVTLAAMAAANAAVA
jgi:acetyl esterase/lipase